MRTAIYSDVIAKNFNSVEPMEALISTQEFRNLYNSEADRGLIDPVGVSGSKQPALEPGDIYADVESKADGSEVNNILIGIYGANKFNSLKANGVLPMSDFESVRILTNAISRESTVPIKIQLRDVDYNMDPLLIRAINRELLVQPDKTFDETYNTSQNFVNAVSKSYSTYARENSLFKSAYRKKLEGRTLDQSVPTVEGLVESVLPVGPVQKIDKQPVGVATDPIRVRRQAEQKPPEKGWWDRVFDPPSDVDTERLKKRYEYFASFFPNMGDTYVHRPGWETYA